MQAHLGSTTTKTTHFGTGGEKLMDVLKIDNTKKSHTGCDHPDSLHEEGLCWKVTNPELEGEPTNKKYCPCSENKGLIRTHERVGYMEADPHDQMVTKRCDVCNIEGLFKVDSAICGPCKSYYRYNAE